MKPFIHNKQKRGEIEVGHALKYLYESISNYIEEEPISEAIYQKIEKNKYETEEDFIEDLQEEEIEHLDMLLEREISYAKRVEDEVRVKELYDIYELLF